MIRQAVRDDLVQLTTIYNQAIQSGRSTADTEVFEPEDRAAWLSAHDQARTPLYVLEEQGRVLGYAYLSEYRPGRQALAGVAEISYYVDFAHHGRGIGTQLVAHTIEAASRLGYRHLIAILLSCNEPSLALLQRFGFREWGVMPDIVRIGSRTCSHVYWGLALPENRTEGDNT